MEVNMIEDRLIIAAIETEGMPFPQRVLRAGLKRITPEQMAERFSCQTIQDAQNALILKEFIAKVLKDNGLDSAPENWEINQFRITGSFLPGTAEYDKNVQYGKFETWRGDKKWLWRVEGQNQYYDEKPSSFKKTVASNRRFAECKVEIVPVEKYVEPMPDRVMNSYLAACSLGFTEFAVAYPELKIQEIPIPQKDPILLGRCADFWFEIDYWE